VREERNKYIDGSQHQFTWRSYTFERCASVEHRPVWVTESIYCLALSWFQHRCGGSVVLTPYTNVMTTYWSLRRETDRECRVTGRTSRDHQQCVCLCRERRTQQTLRWQCSQHQFTFTFYALIPHSINGDWPLLSVQCNSWHWTDTKITWVYVCVCVCPHKPFVHVSDHNFCPIFLKFGTWVTHVKTTTKFGGQVPRSMPPF